MQRIVLSAACMVVLAAFTSLLAPQSSDAVPVGTLIARTAPLDMHPERNRHHVFLVDLEALLSSFASSGLVEIPSPEGTKLARLFERDLFAPGGRAVLQEDGNGNWVTIEEITARTFFGNLVGEEEPSRVTLTVDARHGSMIGTLEAANEVYHFESVPEVAESAFAIVRVNWRDGVEPTVRPFALRESPSVMDGIETMHLSPSVDDAFANTHSDYTSRITAQYNEQHDDWFLGADIHQAIQNIRRTSNTWSKDCVTQITSYKSWMLSRFLTGVDTYPLFTGVDLTAETNRDRDLLREDITSDPVGCSFHPPGSCGKDTLGVNSECALSVVEAVDHFSVDTYDPDRADHLAKNSMHETAHNAGEPTFGGDSGHMEDLVCGHYVPGTGLCDQNSYNVMTCCKSFFETGFWFTSGPPHSHDTESEIIAYAYPRLA